MKMIVTRRVVVIAIVVGSGVFSPLALNQAWAAAEDNHVYLEEPATPPPATQVRQLDRKQNYADDTLRVEYQVIQLSDDTQRNHGKYVEYYRDGKKFQEGTFENGAYAGEWSYWHPNGQLCKTITFVDGAPDGQWDVLRADGTKSARQSYAKGLRQGTWTMYYPDGDSPMVEVSYNAGKLEGKRLTYNNAGQVRQEMNFVDNQLDGPMIEWDDSGKKTAETMFQKGKRIAPIKRF